MFFDRTPYRNTNHTTALVQQRQRVALNPLMNSHLIMTSPSNLGKFICANFSEDALNHSVTRSDRHIDQHYHHYYIPIATHSDTSAKRDEKDTVA